MKDTINKIINILEDESFNFGNEIIDVVLENGAPVEIDYTKGISIEQLKRINQLRREYKICLDILDYVESKRKECINENN